MIRPIYILNIVEMYDYTAYFENIRGTSWRECYRNACNFYQNEKTDQLVEEGLTDGAGNFTGETPDSDEAFYRKTLENIHEEFGKEKSSFYVNEHHFGINADTGETVYATEIPNNTSQYIDKLGDKHEK